MKPEFKGASDTMWMYDAQCGFFPITVYRLSGLDQALAVFAGASAAAGLSLKDVLKERKVCAKIREWLRKNCSRPEDGISTTFGHLDQSTITLELSPLPSTRLRRRGQPNISQNF